MSIHIPVAPYLTRQIIKIGEIIDGLDKYDDYVDDTHSHGLWIDRQEEAMTEIIEIVDIFDGWKVFCAERLKAAKETLPKEYQTLSKINAITGISIPQLSKYFNGREVPHLKNLKKLCIYFNVPADFLLGLKIQKIEKIQKIKKNEKRWLSL